MAKQIEDKTKSPTLRDVPAIIGRGVANYRQAAVPGTLMALAVIVLYAGARLTAQSFVNSDDLLVAFLIDAAGLTAATVLALPWFRLHLSVERGHGTKSEDLATPLWGSMLVAALYFWGGILLGIRYMLGIPSVFMLIWFGLFGFSVAAGEKRGLLSLGTSVRLGQGRRIVVAGVAIVLAFINLLGALPIGAGVRIETSLLAILLLAVTTNISMGAGAHLFDWLSESESA